MSDRPVMVGIGEILWDILPTRTVLGGAPTNFAYIATLLGNEGIIASRLGQDDPGRRARAAMLQLGLNPDYVQEDMENRSGSAEVTLDSGGQPRFSIPQPVAWDFLQWNEVWEELAARASVVCFGSLAQRSAASAGTIDRFLRNTSAKTLRICDVNLREPFYTTEILRRIFALADLLKLNDQELRRISTLMELESDDEERIAARLLDEYDLRLVCITRGARGSLLISRDQVAEHPGFAVKVSDAVGAGDAFTACLAHFYVRGQTLDEINERANRFGSWVATQVGATPAIGNGDLEAILSGPPETAS